jgi:hypothetical protein
LRIGFTFSDLRAILIMWIKDGALNLPSGIPPAASNQLDANWILAVFKEGT